MIDLQMSTMQKVLRRWTFQMGIATYSEIHYTLKVAKFRFVLWLMEWLYSQNVI
jgi:hypothetical protein